ncbi:hypothetical protein SDRG_10032 [Saprolegnia diclina VS20]|uniref:Uncharacterized protein n=1 Tax=Saprolegnia diclina (strain VS20) TaxID=1156394 RepID=T0Q350_SAPDV|nr:hypothetical protein SDRG_10032 [Saprolegnia diclina VS20]EQC32284.1 hypothetical protein SDRG_10032 [Saprolegnia diclina VS20]|eukprot:XP_008614225.1 hypothetical protein SDRG_10032 [Saprolegnia diclina VS20]
MVALSALGTFLLAANLSSFDPTTVRPTDDTNKTIFAVRADLSRGRFASAKPVAAVTFPIADVTSTVYVSRESYARATEAVKPSEVVANFVNSLLFAQSSAARECLPNIYGASKLNTSFEFEFSDKPSMTTTLEAKPNTTTATVVQLAPGTVSQVVFRVNAGCLDYATLACNLDAASGATSFRIGVTRAEYLDLHPSSLMAMCGNQWDSRPVDIDPNVNIAFAVPSGTWVAQTVADDAKAFFSYKAPATTTTKPSSIAPTPTPTPSAASTLSLSTSVFACLAAIWLIQ